MKRLIVAVVFGVIILGFGVTEAETGSETEDKTVKETENENFTKAGQELLERLETKLQKLKHEIDKYIQEEISKDSRINGNEIRMLRKKIKRFNNEKKVADKRLTFYNLKTITAINKTLESALSGYITRDKGGKIRKYFAKLTGRDLPVIYSVSWLRVIIGVVCVVFGVCAFLYVVQDPSLSNFTPETLVLYDIFLLFGPIIVGVVMLTVGLGAFG